MSERCETCRFAQRTSSEGWSWVGQCRRNPPYSVGSWPQVVSDDWCGEWRAREADIDIDKPWQWAELYP